MIEAEHTLASLRRLRRWIVPVLATLLFVWVALYRFNTLGGSFGGFDNDHFVQFAYAKQVEAGEQPLREFQAGVQGARPSLTFELSAAAQRYLGDNLRSEAWLTVAGVALASALTFVAASQIAPWPWALITALLSALISPKLYNYPKVLVLSVAALIIVRYAARPAWRRVVWMSAWTGIAFLFRHDYAVYCGVGFAAVLGLSHWDRWLEGATRAMVYGLVTVTLLAPSLWWIHEYSGLSEYVRNTLEMGRREAERTDIGWPQPDVRGVSSVSMVFERRANSEAWLYYLFLAIPVVTIAVACGRWARRGSGPDHSDAALIALGLMTAVLSHYFLRGRLEARFGDMAPPVALIGASLLAAALSRGPTPLVPWLVRAALALIVLAVTGVSIWSMESVGAELVTGRILEWPATIAERTSRISQELVDLPRALRLSLANDRMEASDYLYRCTRPSDRVLVVGYAPEVPVFAERLFAGGRATFVYGYYLDERYSRETLARLATESVPIALAEPEGVYERTPIIANYLKSTYVDVGSVMASGRPLRVLVQRRAPGNPSGPRGLPCFT
jgi:hypothetical protein